MKNIGTLFIGLVTTACFAQNTSGFLFANVNPRKEVNSCYKASPAVVLHTQPHQVLFQSTDGGTSWIDLSEGLPEGIAISNAFVKGSQAYVGTRDGKLFFNHNISTSIW